MKKEEEPETLTNGNYTKLGEKPSFYLGSNGKRGRLASTSNEGFFQQQSSMEILHWPPSSKTECQDASTPPPSSTQSSEILRSKLLFLKREEKEFVPKISGSPPPPSFTYEASHLNLSGYFSTGLFIMW